MTQFIFWMVMVSILVLVLWFCVILAREDSVIIGTLLGIIFTGIWVLLVPWAASELWGSHPTFTLRKDRWECTAEVVSQSPPTYIKTGSVMTPIGGGEVRECTQYNKRFEY